MLLKDFMVNQSADTLLLFLIRQRLFPELSPLRIYAGGFLASATYLAWTLLIRDRFRLMDALTALLIISLLLILVFRIRSLQIFFSAWSALLFYACLAGGAAYAARTLFFSRLPLSMTVYGSLLSLCFAGLLAGFRKAEEKTGHLKQRDHLYQLEIYRGGRHVRCTGLFDSGNQLTSLLTGEGICIITHSEGWKLLSREERLLCQRGESAPDRGIYDICYQSLTDSYGRMQGVLADRILVSRGGKVLVRKAGMVAICPGGLSATGRYKALLPADIFQ